MSPTLLRQQVRDSDETFWWFNWRLSDGKQSNSKQFSVKIFCYLVVWETNFWIFMLSTDRKVLLETDRKTIWARHIRSTRRAPFYQIYWPPRKHRYRHCNTIGCPSNWSHSSPTYEIEETLWQTWSQFIWKTNCLMIWELLNGHHSMGGSHIRLLRRSD